MGRELLVREIKAAALARMEDAARTEKDFNAVVKQWNHNDRNRERKERYWEIGRPNEEMLHWDRINENDEKGRIKEGLDTVIPPPLNHPYWRQLIRGDFIDTIYDNAFEMWQLIEDPDISSLLKSLTEKQKEVLFLRVVRLCTAAQIACYHDKTDRAVRKLFAAALDSIQDKLAPLIRQQIEAEHPQMTLAKREFLAWYDKKKNAAIDSGDGE
ncbi:hypothetical protein LJC63_02260 [Ruminococcaceae bacterium OttesenSCG-928-L11]|nr:hypothetical protein [Ruminococcaceae bacterium OttesenSCG-928-L11]